MILCTERISSQCLSGITEIKSLAENVIWFRCQKWEIEKKEMGNRENEISNGKLHKQCYNKMEHLQYRMTFYIDFNVTALRFVQLTSAHNTMNISKLHLYR